MSPPCSKFSVGTHHNLIKSKALNMAPNPERFGPLAHLTPFLTTVSQLAVLEPLVFPVSPEFSKLFQPRCIHPGSAACNSLPRPLQKFLTAFTFLLKLYPDFRGDMPSLTTVSKITAPEYSPSLYLLPYFVSCTYHHLIHLFVHLFSSTSP